MDKSLIAHIVYDFRNHSNPVLLVENNDGFLYREDVIQLCKENNIKVVIGSSIKQRVEFELRDTNSILVLLSEDNSEYLEDIKQNSSALEFFIKDYISGYHIPTISNESIHTLEVLYQTKQLVALSKSQTIQKVKKVKSVVKKVKAIPLDLEELSESLDKVLTAAVIDWVRIAKITSKALLASIGTKQLEQVMLKIKDINAIFQDKLKRDFQSSKNSSAIKKPQIVSKILDYLNFNFKKEKVALIVVDGLSYWQYQLLSKKLPGLIKEDVIYSWIPSITQLSRQAIFRGDTPETDYKQGPINEGKLWENYWKKAGLNDTQIRYSYEAKTLTNLTRITKLAIVYKDLDSHMHHSNDYKMLKYLTLDWLERSEITTVIKELLEQEYKIFLTTDHGNIQA
ncbi:MAG: PglZ domain-containing protein, partial [Urechidicola sp.]